MKIISHSGNPYKVVKSMEVKDTDHLILMKETAAINIKRGNIMK